MDYELIIKIFSVVLGSGAIGTILWNVRKMYEAKLNSKKKDIYLKRDTNGVYEFNANGLFNEGEILKVIKELNIEKPKNASLQLIKSERKK